MFIKDHELKHKTLGDKELIFELCDWSDDAADPVYLGYVTETGAWIIKRINSSLRQIRWARGSTDYATAWANKTAESMTYGLYNSIF